MTLVEDLVPICVGTILLGAVVILIAVLLTDMTETVIVPPSPSPSPVEPSITPSVTVSAPSPYVVLDDFEASTNGPLTGQTSQIPGKVWEVYNANPALDILGGVAYSSDNTTRVNQIQLNNYTAATDTLTGELKTTFQNTQTGSTVAYSALINSASGDGVAYMVSWNQTFGSLAVNLIQLVNFTVSGLIAGTSVPGPDPTDNPSEGTEVTINFTLAPDGTVTINFKTYSYTATVPALAASSGIGIDVLAMSSFNNAAGTNLPLINSITVSKS